MKVIEQSIEKLFDAVRINFDETKRFSLIINIIFMGFVILGFFIFWIPFIAEENETIYKIKGILCLIPKIISSSEKCEEVNLSAKLLMSGRSSFPLPKVALVRIYWIFLSAVPLSLRNNNDISIPRSPL